MPFLADPFLEPGVLVRHPAAPDLLDRLRDHRAQSIHRHAHGPGPQASGTPETIGKLT